MVVFLRLPRQSGTIGQPGLVQRNLKEGGEVIAGSPSS